jgi:hypothetical protein
VRSGAERSLECQNSLASGSAQNAGRRGQHGPMTIRVKMRKAHRQRMSSGFPSTTDIASGLQHASRSPRVAPPSRPAELPCVNCPSCSMPQASALVPSGKSRAVFRASRGVGGVPDEIDDTIKNLLLPNSRTMSSRSPDGVPSIMLSGTASHAGGP